MKSAEYCRRTQATPKVAAGESRTDRARADAMSQADIERLANEEDGPLADGWGKTAMIGLPPGKDAIKLRIDRDVLAWFRQTGKSYQTRINNVLWAFVTYQQVSGHRQGPAGSPCPDEQHTRVYVSGAVGRGADRLTAGLRDPLWRRQG
jgi:uncharacterized protein (DUF4415 family)